ncbi:MAG TPA: ABC transporter permease [Fimbriimonadaceae bacterium]|nr:ABC transporter permease [Fimbriimonadaceae bacterium]
MLKELIIKDLKVYFSDRRALIISMLVPIGIACFMASIFGNAGKTTEAAKLPILVADQDQSELTHLIEDKLKSDPHLDVRIVDGDVARQEIKDGKSAAALILPKGFSAQAISGGKKPEITFLSDPAQSMEVQAIRGNVMQPIVSAMVGGGQELQMPFDFHNETQSTGRQDESGAAAAHVFDGMAVQGLLFFSIEAAMGILRERKLGIWRRIRAAPVSPSTLFFSRIVSGAIRALSILIGVLGVGGLVFHLQLGSNLPGLFAIGIAASLMAAAFGMFVAALGRNEQQSRGLSIFVVLTMTMLGGAWFPSFLMPDWVQKISMVVPVKWAVDGFDAMTWRGGQGASVGQAVGVLLVFALVFGVIALTRFRWDAETA